jgi:hypothetical protein
MKKKYANLIIIKKIAILFFLITSYQNYGQAIANQPSNYLVCDTLNNGIENISLSIKNIEILGSQSSEEFSVTYFNTLTDAQVNANTIGNYYAATNEIIYAKVTENDNTSNFDITSFQIILSQMVVPVFPTPAPVCQGTQVIYGISSTNGIIGTWDNHISYDTPPGNYTFTFTPISGQCAEIITMTFTVNPIPTTNILTNISLSDLPYDGVATFDLTQQNNTIIGSQSNINITFYSNQNDAFNGINAITNPTSYNNTSNPQLIGVRITNDLTGCYTTTSFSISVINPNPNIINFTDASFKTKLISANTSNYIAYSGGTPVKIDSNDDFEIQYSEAAVIDSLNIETNSGGINLEKILDL